MFEYIRAIYEIRPRYLLWENVPGCLSAKGQEGEKGGALRQLLSELCDIGYGLAWRVLDAQFFGVAQRRRRVFLVGCLGDPHRAAEILFEPESLRWDTPSSAEQREALAARNRVRTLGGGPALPGQDDGEPKGERSGSVRGKGRTPEPAYALQIRCGCSGGAKVR